jgi:hypothetical protein
VTWGLHKIVLYSHDGRRHDVPENGFKAAGVSIIIGDSNTGKSAILEIINYCLGASECEIADYIKRRCSWVGIQFRRAGQFLLLCRQIPAGSRKSTDAYFLKAGTVDNLPEGKDALRTMGAAGLEHFEQALGIGALKLEDQTTPGGFSVSVRHCAPYSLVRDDVIINKSVLVSGSRDEKKARHVRETLPYFLGHVTEDAIRVREQLRRRRAELRAREGELAQRQLIANEGSLRLTSFIDKARSLGLIPATAAVDTPAQQRAALLAVAEFRVSTRAAAPESERYALDERIADFRRRLLQLQERRRAVLQSTKDASAFWSAASGQHGRLQALDLLDDSHEPHACPICSANLSQRAEPTRTLRTAMQALQRDIGEATYDRPRLDRYLLELDEEIDTLKLDQERDTKRLDELIKLDTALQRDRGLDEARLRLAGQVEFYLASTNLEDLSVEEGEVERLRTIVAGLEQEAAGVNIADDMNDDAVILSAGMKDVIAKLPFAAEYREAVPIFDWKTLQVHLRVDGKRKVPMSSIGSDENYLAIHLAFFLSIQKLFAARNRPVLQFIILDQVTRPYFPDDQYTQIVELTSQGEAPDEVPPARQLSDEVGKVKRIFDMLFRESAMPNAPQIIICEKANFRRDPTYQAAIVTFWASPHGMVPDDWPAEG